MLLQSRAEKNRTKQSSTEEISQRHVECAAQSPTGAGDSVGGNNSCKALTTPTAIDDVALEL